MELADMLRLLQGEALSGLMCAELVAAMIPLEPLWEQRRRDDTQLRGPGIDFGTLADGASARTVACGLTGWTHSGLAAFEGPATILVVTVACLA